MPQRCLTQSGLHAFEPRYHTRSSPEVIAELDDYNIADDADLMAMCEVREYVGDICPHCGTWSSPTASEVASVEG